MSVLLNSTIQFASAPRIRQPNKASAPIPSQQKKAKAAEREVRQEEIDKIVVDWYAETAAKANELAERFDKKPRYFLDLFFHAGARMVRHHEKVNPHNAFLSLKARDLRDEGEACSLLQIQQDFRDEYMALGEDEREELVREHKENIDVYANAPRVSPRGRILDCANIVRNMTRLLNGLKLRVGVEGFFCIVRNTTSFHMSPQWFFTSEALASYMKIASKRWNVHDVGTKLEAFAIAGCDPVNLITNSKKRADFYKAEIRDKINTTLIEITGNPAAVMHYSRYEEEIVQRYGIVLEGWTYENFVNPSELSSSLPPLRNLRDALVNGQCKFVKLTAAERKKREEDYAKKIASGEITVPLRKKRKDAGVARKSRKRTKTGKDTGKRNVDDDDGEDDDDDSDADLPAGIPKSAPTVDSD